MKISTLVLLSLLICLGAAPVVHAESFAIKPEDSIQKVLAGRQGKRVTLRLQGGEELTGKIRTVTSELVQLGDLSGREYFDAVVEVSRIAAVIIRVKE